jgi:hypothetical protein
VLERVKSGEIKSARDILPPSEAIATGDHRSHQHFPPMHADTLAALRLLAVTLILHPEDAAELSDYGHLPDHLGDVIDDYIDEDEA